MSTPRHRISPKFLSLIHARGLTVEALARLAQSGRCHVTQVLANKPGRGHLTRRRLAPYLSNDEIKALGWPVKRNQFDPSSPWNVTKP